MNRKEKSHSRSSLAEPRRDHRLATTLTSFALARLHLIVSRTIASYIWANERNGPPQRVLKRPTLRSQVNCPIRPLTKSHTKCHVTWVETRGSYFCPYFALNEAVRMNEAVGTGHLCRTTFLPPLSRISASTCTPAPGKAALAKHPQRKWHVKRNLIPFVVLT